MDKRQQILAGKICPYCGKETELIDSAEVYQGVSYGWMYICRPCDAYVGCYKGTTKALGRLANAELRKYKHEAKMVRSRRGNAPDRGGGLRGGCPGDAAGEGA